MATPKSTVAYLPGEDPEILAANEAYQAAQAKLSESLDRRKSKFFDPVWLAAAEGFSKPTPFFSESLGNASKSIREAQQLQQKEDEDIASQKLGLAGQNIELLRLKQRDRAMSQYLGDEPAAPKPAGGLPSAGALPMGAGEPDQRLLGGKPMTSNTGAPVSGLTAVSKPPGMEGVEGIPIAPPNDKFMTGRDYLRLNRYDTSKSPADLMREAQEIDRKRYEAKDTGILDLASGLFYQFPSGKTEEVQIYGYPGTYKVDTGIAARLAKLAATGDAKGYKDLADRTVKGPMGADSAMKSQENLALEQERTKALEAQKTAQEVEDRKNFAQRFRDADETITTANMFREFASRPDAKKMFGILNNDKISSGIATLVRGGIGIPGFTAGTKDIEDIMRNAGLNDQQQAQYRTFLMLAAQQQLQQTKYMKGSVSDFEQRLMASAGINAQDTPDTIRIKADIMTRRAQFDRRVNKAFKSSKMTADQFLNSSQYDEMRDEYNKELAKISVGELQFAPKPSAAPSGKKRFEVVPQ
jgi:hypothetical protein